jgi:hypothetical protein
MISSFVTFLRQRIVAEYICTYCFRKSCINIHSEAKMEQKHTYVPPATLVQRFETFHHETAAWKSVVKSSLRK